MAAEFATFSEFRVAVFRIVNGHDYSEPVIQTLMSFIQPIASPSRRLPDPFSSDTTAFMDEFSPKVISFILKSDPTDTKFASLLRKVLSAYATLFLNLLLGDQFDFFLEGATNIFPSSGTPFYAV
jgi:hypothetical protein